MKALLPIVCLMLGATVAHVSIDPRNSVRKAVPKTVMVTITWSNHPNAWASNIVTGLESTSDMKTWTEVALLPYTERVQVFRQGNGRTEFYRAFNRIKQ